jgi:hypothetical protein
MHRDASQLNYFYYKGHPCKYPPSTIKLNRTLTVSLLPFVFQCWAVVRCVVCRRGKVRHSELREYCIKITEKRVCAACVALRPDDSGPVTSAHFGVWILKSVVVLLCCAVTSG